MLSSLVRHNKMTSPYFGKVLRLSARLGFQRSTGLVLEDGSIAVLRIGDTRYRGKGNWLNVYRTCEEWTEAMDLRNTVLC